jgi:hypothetical protein
MYQLIQVVKNLVLVKVLKKIIYIYLYTNNVTHLIQGE